MSENTVEPEQPTLGQVYELVEEVVRRLERIEEAVLQATPAMVTPPETPDADAAVTDPAGGDEDTQSVLKKEWDESSQKWVYTPQ